MKADDELSAYLIKTMSNKSAVSLSWIFSATKIYCLTVQAKSAPAYCRLDQSLLISQISLKSSKINLAKCLASFEKQKVPVKNFKNWPVCEMFETLDVLFSWFGKSIKVKK